MSLLVVDNLSPFTPDIGDCLGKLSIPYICRKFSEVSDLDLDRCNRVILSGRRKNITEINAANSRIVRHCSANDVPLLGICYGAEIIALALGGSIRKMPVHVYGTTTVLVSDVNALTDDKKSISVFESHKYCIAKLPPSFKSLASSTYCEHEIFVGGKIYGTQFHPEKSGDDGIRLLQNFART